MSHQVWTISNILSLCRIVLVIPIGWLLMEPTTASRAWSLVLVMIAMLTDLLDGMLARRLNQVTELGKIIDPLADKVAAAVVVLILSVHGMVPLWFVGLIILRDLVILAGGVYVHRRTGTILQSTLTGKWAVTVVSWYVLAVILGMESLRWLEQILLVSAVLLLLGSAVLYGRRFFATLRT